MPGIGAVLLTGVFAKTVVDTVDPAYGSGGSLFGIGSVFVIGVGMIALGAVLMALWQLRAPAYFRSETLRHDTPALEIAE